MTVPGGERQARPVARLLAWMRPIRGRMALALLLGALTVGSSVALMATSAWLISMAALRPSIAALNVAVVGVRFFGIARGLLRYLERLVAHDATLRLLARIRVELYRAIEPLAPAGLEALRSGDLAARWVGDVEALQTIYLRSLAPPLVALATAGGLFVLLAAFDLWAALAALLLYLACGAGIMLLAQRRGTRSGRALVQTRSEFSAALVDMLQGLPDRIACGAGRPEEALLRQSEETAAHEGRLARLDALQNALTTLFAPALALSVLAIAVGRVDGLYLATLALASAAACEALAPLGAAAAAWGGSMEAAGRLFALADAPPQVTEPERPAPPPTTFDLALEDVTARYAPGLPPVLENLHLRIAQGEHVAIVGESGAGKSTLVSLLVRFRDVETGSISVGGVDLRTLPLEEVRRIFAVMDQRTHLFNTTLRENIRLGNGKAGDAEVERAARAAAIHDFIAGLPHGYETMAGENGVKLSGGERQRVALARLLLRNAPILLLDEPTAHLDARTAQEVVRALLDVAAGRTVILLTHERSLLPLFDRVVALPSVDAARRPM